MTPKKDTSPVRYRLDDDGTFIIENYNQSKPFSNFFPGIAGVWGIPMWVFYVNRGQCIASFGIESKDKAIMEFQPAGKSYRLTSLQGFRTFIKATTGGKTVYWEPFQNHIHGTAFKKTQILSANAHDLTLREDNIDLGLSIEVNYFTLPQEPYAALVRRVTIKNTGKKNYHIEIIDGLPVIVPYGLKDSINKNMARTVEAWVKVRHVKQKAPFYHLNVEVSDEPEVTHITEGNFFFGFIEGVNENRMLDPIVEAAHVFGTSQDFLAPVKFLEKSFKMPLRQHTDNRTPSAMGHGTFSLRSGADKHLTSLFGTAHDERQLTKIVRQVKSGSFSVGKAEENRTIIEGIKQMALTNSSSRAFDLYAGYTFLDNILRGGLPVSVKTNEGNVAFNVYSRKHGDLERDYNYFVVAPTYFSQGNGNYRDVNQNRRNDVWFNADVKESHLVNFLNLIQADGYNPLIVKGTAFFVNDTKRLNHVLTHAFKAKDRETVRLFIDKGFTPGALLKLIDQDGIDVQVDIKAFLGQILEVCRKQELADHGEGFWSDHWTYNLDLLESYFAVYPEHLKDLLVEKKIFHFYHNIKFVLPRDRRYILTERGVRQYNSVASGVRADGDLLRTKKGAGDVYSTHLLCKILCLIANKAATLDPSGIGIEMEADKPNWYDALNGLPGLLGSSVSETFELKRLCLFLLESIDEIGFSETENILVFEELGDFISGLSHHLSLEPDALLYWQKSNDLKEHFRAFVRVGITGHETALTIGQIKNFLKLVTARTDKGISAAKTPKGYLGTYFYHEVTEHRVLAKSGETTEVCVQPLNFKRHDLPLSLEGYVHALRVARDTSQARELYLQVRHSPLFDRKLKMYKVNADLSSETEEIGRARVFPAGWLENESVWLHMEYKFLLELLRSGLYEEFYANFNNILIPFLDPNRYGRNILENSSFIVSSAHADQSLHGQGFVARLSGSTAEFIHIWLLMNVGRRPFRTNADGELTFILHPALPGRLFTKEKSQAIYRDETGKCCRVDLPKNTYMFHLFGSTRVVYHNPHRRNTYAVSDSSIHEIHLTYANRNKPVVISAGSLTGQYARDVRDRKIERMDVFFS